jgi:hypothetical protein
LTNSRYKNSTTREINSGLEILYRRKTVEFFLSLRSSILEIPSSKLSAIKKNKPRKRDKKTKGGALEGTKPNRIILNKFTNSKQQQLTKRFSI